VYVNCNRVGVKKHADRPCMGTRTMVGGKIGEYKFQTYKQVGARLTAFGSGLKAIGVEHVS
jgi:long-subunit acyl-CoA synthetase (AMP-forming)